LVIIEKKYQMKKILKQKLAMILLILFISNLVNAQDTSIFSKLEKSTNGHNTGTVWLNEISAPDSTFEYVMAFASYANSSWLDWHSHPGGQILIITEGTGYYQEKGQPKRIVHKGDIIKCQPNVQHWHGSTPTTTFSYIATAPSQKGKTQWFKPVTEEEYKN
jgi:quercetin dioxygenase-like cupin family protein